MDFYQQYLKYRLLYLQESKRYPPIQYYTTNDGNHMSYYIDSIDNYKESDFIYPSTTLAPSLDKIVFINSIEAFDKFTTKYGKYDKENDEIFIQWDIVKNRFKGFYLDKTNTDLKIQRYPTLPFGKGDRIKYVGSWYSELIPIHGVIIFVNQIGN